MSTDRDTTRIVRSWLEEGATALPDRVLDAVLDQVPATPQRRPLWPAWRFRQMNTSLNSPSPPRPSWSSRSRRSASRACPGRKAWADRPPSCRRQPCRISRRRPPLLQSRA